MQESINALNNINKHFATLSANIKNNQANNDYSLNSNIENRLRDVLNFVYQYNLINVNYEKSNSKYIDLVDKNKKIAYQITSEATTYKIDKTLEGLNSEYHGYDIKIFYLLDKPKLSSKNKDILSSKFHVDISKCLVDFSDLIKDINNLTTDGIIELNDKYFQRGLQGTVALLSEELHDKKTKLQEFEELLSDFICPYCNSPLLESGEAPLDEEQKHWDIRKVFTCGYQIFGSYVEHLCTINPNLPKFEEYELRCHHRPNEQYWQWLCFAIGKTDAARKLNLKGIYGRTKDEAETGIRKQYQRYLKQINLE